MKISSANVEIGEPMSILIKGMDMPISCEKCPLCYDYLCCSIDDSLHMFLYNRHPNCPLIDIVTCGECKWGDTGIDEEGKPFWKCLGIHYGGTKPTDFCSYGERANNTRSE